MRILFFIILSLLISSNSYSAEVIDCSPLKFLAKLNEKQSETKKKISKNAKDLKSKVDKKLKVESK